MGEKVDGNVHSAFCQICEKSNSIAHGSSNDIKRYIEGPDHKRVEKSRKSFSSRIGNSSLWR